MQSLRSLQKAALRPLFAQSRYTPTKASSCRFSQITQPAFRTRPGSSALYQSLRTPYTSRAFSKTTRRLDSVAASSSSNLTISQRMRKLSREYGWSALGVYLALSALDFPFCFLAVRLLGTDRIGHWEHVVLSYVKAAVKWPLPDEAKEYIDGASSEVKKAVREQVPLQELRDGGEVRILEEDKTYVLEDHGYRAAEKANRGENASEYTSSGLREGVKGFVPKHSSPGIWTQLALAYAIHKSFIFLRVPITAAVTPKVVKTLRGWGWDIGKRTPKRVTGSGTGVNTGTTGVKPPGT